MRVDFPVPRVTYRVAVAASSGTGYTAFGADYSLVVWAGCFHWYALGEDDSVVDKVVVGVLEGVAVSSGRSWYSSEVQAIVQCSHLAVVLHPEDGLIHDPQQLGKQPPIHESAWLCRQW